MLYDATRIAFEEGMGEEDTAAIHLAAERLDVPRPVVDTIIGLVRDEAEIDAMRAAELFPERKHTPQRVTAEGRILVGGSLLDMLSRSDRARLFALGRPRIVEAGEDVVRQGTIGDTLFVVEDGELAVVRSLPGRSEEVLGTAKPGTLLGELAVLDRGARTASMRATRRSVLREIGLGAFEALTLHGGDTGHRILRAVAASVHERLNAIRRIATGATQGAQAPASPAIGWKPAGAETIDMLCALSVFPGVQRSDWERLKAGLVFADVARGADLVFPTSADAGVAMVLRGALSPWLVDGRGPELTTPVVGPGGFVDYATALKFATEPRRWRARSPTRLLSLDASLFDAREESSPHSLYALSRSLATTVRRTTGLSVHFRMAWVQR